MVISRQCERREGGGRSHVSGVAPALFEKTFDLHRTTTQTSLPEGKCLTDARATVLWAQGWDCQGSSITGSGMALPGQQYYGLRDGTGRFNQ